MNQITSIRIAAITLFLGISLGAFGAHGLEKTLIANGHVDTWETATFYHLIHGVVLFFLALTRPKRWGYGFFLAGIIIFSGSLYVLSITGYSKLGMITPIGGVAFLLGWARWIFGGAKNLTN